MSSEESVRAYKGLAKVEKAFRCCKSVDLKVRPIFHRLPERVKAHLFICMLAYYLEWHLRDALAPILFEDEDKEIADSLRETVVDPIEKSEKARRKATTKRTDEGLPVHSFQTLLKDLSTIVLNWVQPKIKDAECFTQTTEPSPVHKKAFKLLDVSL